MHYGLGGPLAASFSYDGLGRRLGSAAGGASTAYGYDPISRLASLGHGLAGTASDQNLTFGYSPASQIVIRTSSNDAYASNTAYAVSRPYSVNGLNQYTAAGPAAFLYDGNGNLRADGSSNYVYDAENRLVSASGATSATLSYDPLGRLFQVSSGGVTTQFLYDGDELVAEYSGLGTLLRRYAHGLGNDDPVLWYEGAGLTTRRSLFANHQGSIVAVADGSGNALAINAYDAWGIPNAGNQGRFGYTGQTWLAEFGMWHYKARIYSPTLGRFLQTDPVGYDDQINLYSYVHNDPVNLFDNTGEWSMAVHYRIFRAALDSRVTDSERRLVLRTSTIQDLPVVGNYSNNYMHYLRDVGELPRVALQRFERYVEGAIRTGQRLVEAGDRGRALQVFARAAHAIQDAYSRPHNENGLPAQYEGREGEHSPRDGIGREGTDDLTPEVERAMVRETQRVYERIFNERGPERIMCTGSHIRREVCP